MRFAPSSVQRPILRLLHAACTARAVTGCHVPAEPMCSLHVQIRRRMPSAGMRSQPERKTHMCIARYAQVLLLLKDAKAVKKEPFTIQLRCEGTEYTFRPLYGGTGRGRTNIGDAVPDEMVKRCIDHANEEHGDPEADRKAQAVSAPSRQGRRTRRIAGARKCRTVSVPYESCF